jgi:hypothetical protein
LALKIEVQLPGANVAPSSIITITMCNLFVDLLFAMMAVYIIFAAAPPYSFIPHPTIYEGHTAVHLMSQGRPFAPAYMVFEQGIPHFYHLYTNQSIGSYREYTHLYSQRAAYKAIYTSMPMYKGYSLYRILTRVKPFRPESPAIHRIFELRTRVWWERCVRNWEEFRR